MRRPLTDTVLSAALCAALPLLAACGGGDPKPIFSSTSPPSTPAASSSSVAGPPVMPDAAKQHTKAGAIAFVKYYWDVVNYAQKSLDVGPLEALQDGHCNECRGGERVVEAAAADNGKIRGGRLRVTSAVAQPVRAATGRWFSVKFKTVSTSQVVDLPGTHRDKHYPGGPETGSMMLRPVGSGWQVDLLVLS